MKGREPSHNSFRYLSGIAKNSTRGNNVTTGNMLAQNGEKLTLFQNMGDPEYWKIVFGSLDIGVVFAKHRKPFRKERMMELVDGGTKKIPEKAIKSKINMLLEIVAMDRMEELI